MKNNQITLSQFWFSMFLSTLISILFLDLTASAYQLVWLIGAVVLNLIVIFLYKGRPNIVLKTVAVVYLVVFSVLSVSKFVDFMHSALDSGPYWAIAIILMIFTFFCTVKGIESITRASVIIGFFAAVFLIYIFAGSVKFVDFQSMNMSMDSLTGLLSPLSMLFPSAVYVMLCDNIKFAKKYSTIIYSGAAFIVTGYFTLLAASVKTAYPILYITEKSHVGIFKGADCLLLALLSISVLYITALSSRSIFSKSKGNYVSNGIFTVLIFALALIVLYSRTLSEFLFNDSFILIMTAVLVITAIISGIANRAVKNV